ncbi:Bonzai-like protein [Thalictrum thalictroides]|uniref:Bonzai-like protein n=1 Tax=Thalictrum thalictroides TaxID=46969 RepID=A0A7J6W9R8_THATH|nr:Bonzai-like protein [Thalictrum thalictroides]
MKPDLNSGMVLAAIPSLAILEVGEVLQFYDTEKRFAAWGFGAPPIDGPVSHYFKLNGSNYQLAIDKKPSIMAEFVGIVLGALSTTLYGQKGHIMC